MLAWQAVALGRALWLRPDPSLPTPSDMPRQNQDARYALQQDPFYPSANPAAVHATDVAGLRLHGIRRGARASAIVSDAQGMQASHLKGEDIAPGVRLVQVGIDHVLLQTASGRQRLDMANEPFPNAPPPAPAASGSTASSPTTDAAADADAPARALAQAGLQPQQGEGRIRGYAVPSGGLQSLVLQRAGLQPGDIITAVDGQALTAERHGELVSAFAGQRSLRLTVERDGQPRTVTVESPVP